MGKNSHSQPEYDYFENQHQFPTIVPLSRETSIVYFLATFWLPLTSFLLTITGNFLSPEWQDGQIGSYLALMIGGPASYSFYPFLLYSMFCMLILLSAPEKGKIPVIRFGIYTGVILSLQYTLLFQFSSNPFFLSSSGIWLIVIPFLFVINKKTNASEFAQSHRKILILTYGFLGFGLLVLIGVYPQILMLFVFFVISLFIAGPMICLFIYLQISIRLIRHYETPLVLNLWRGLAIVGWLSSFLVAWRFSTIKAFEMYAQLPTNSPGNCYIATAAAQGHPTIVRSHPVNMSNGAVMQINAQLQVLKAAEITLKTISPKIHHRCRMVYDRYGKALARRLTTPARGTLAYLGLKPFEWTARLALRLLLPGIKEISNNLYTNEW